jgi:hypothetical protein
MNTLSAGAVGPLDAKHTKQPVARFKEPDAQETEQT